MGDCPPRKFRPGKPLASCPAVHSGPNVTPPTHRLCTSSQIQNLVGRERHFQTTSGLYSLVVKPLNSIKHKPAKEDGSVAGAIQNSGTVVTQ